MSLEQTRRTWERFEAAEACWGDPEPIVAVHSETFVLNDGVVRGRDALRRYEETFRRAFPEWKREYLEVVLGDDAIATGSRAHATHLGSFLGNEPTGRRVELTGASFMQVGHDGLIFATHVVQDRRQPWEQLGLPMPNA